MARRPMTDLKADMNTRFPDNTTGEISPADLRFISGDFIDTMTPAYGAVSVSTPQVVAVTTTPADFTAWDEILIVTSEFSANLTTGVITMNGDFTIDFAANFTVELNNNIDLTMESVFSGNPFKYRATLTGRGSAKPLSMALQGIYVATPGSTIKIQASIEANNNVTFSNCVWTVRLVPLIDPPSP